MRDRMEAATSCSATRLDRIALVREHGAFAGAPQHFIKSWTRYQDPAPEAENWQLSALGSGISGI
jgi:hypothetical protein